MSDDMSIQLTKRIASGILNRGRRSIRIKSDALDDASKAITREDVRSLISKGSVYALPKKHNLSTYSKILREKRNKGRMRGPGRRKGTAKARGGVDYKKRIRAQRRVLKKLKEEKIIDNQSFKSFYALVKGGNFASKASLLGHIKSKGVKIDDKKNEELVHI